MRLLHRASAAVLAAAPLACQRHSPGTQTTHTRPLTAADSVGFLVGLSSGRTLWIAPRDGAVRLVATRHDLLVPRADGFRWVGSVQRCTVEENDGGGMSVEAGVYVNREEALFVARPGEPARVRLGGVPCDEAEREAMRRTAVRARTAAESLAAAGDSATLRELSAALRR